MGLGPLEPVTATAEAFQILGPGADSVRSSLAGLAEQITACASDVLAVSLTLLDGVGAMTFTLAVSEDRLRALGAVQGLDDGSCTDGAPVDRLSETDPGTLLSEERWSASARASARFGIRSSLSIPVQIDGRTEGGLDVYASSPSALVDHVQEIAALVNATAEDAVRDGDLQFDARTRAQETLAEIEGRATIDVAAGLLAQREGVSQDEAAARIVGAAGRAGVDAADLALLVIKTAARADPGSG